MAAAGQSRILDIVVKQRRRVDAVMADAGELAVAVGPERDGLDGRGLVVHHRVHLGVGELRADRLAHHLSGERREQCVRPGPGLTAEPLNRGTRKQR